MLAEATAICQRVIIIHRGRIVAVDTPEQLGAKLRTSETLSLTVKQSDPQLLEVLHHIPGVIRVSQGATPQIYELETQMGQDIREELTKLVVSRNVGLLELKTQPLTLEEAFKVLTQTDTSGGLSKSMIDENHQR
jgi:ABC-2 type transport system ATP-binding protein